MVFYLALSGLAFVFSHVQGQRPWLYGSCPFGANVSFIPALFLGIRVSLKINARMKDYSSANGADISQPGATAPGMRDHNPIQGLKARDISGFQPLFIIDIPPSPSDWAGISPRRWRSVKSSIASSRVEYWRVR
jgi:hypothetical protein